MWLGDTKISDLYDFIQSYLIRIKLEISYKFQNMNANILEYICIKSYKCDICVTTSHKKKYNKNF